MKTHYTQAPWTVQGHLIVAPAPTENGATLAVIGEGARAHGGWRYACSVASFENLANLQLMSAAPELIESLDPDGLDAIAADVQAAYPRQASVLRQMALMQRAAVDKALIAEYIPDPV